MRYEDLPFQPLPLLCSACDFLCDDLLVKIERGEKILDLVSPIARCFGVLHSQTTQPNPQWFAGVGSTKREAQNLTSDLESAILFPKDSSETLVSHNLDFRNFEFARTKKNFESSESQSRRTGQISNCREKNFEG